MLFNLPVFHSDPATLQVTDPDRYLLYFDMVGVFAQNSAGDIYFIGALENYSPDFPVSKAFPVEMVNQDGQYQLYVDARPWGIPARSSESYQSLFAGQNLGHPATFQILGWVTYQDLPGIFRAMASPLPANANFPLPGEQETPFPLWLPFDCTHDWLVSWGYHEGTPQNRYAVDFASAEGVGMAQGQPVRAAHNGTLYLKIYGYDGQYIDLGLAARVMREDGITSTVYGHLDERTLGYWDTSAEEIGAFEWVEIGQVEAGDVIGFVGTTGYSMGPHIHIVVWTYDQSLYRPVFDNLHQYERGFELPGESRQGCERYPALGE